MGLELPVRAGIVVKALEDAGYSADNIKTGNADKFDNSTTSITAQDNFEEIVNDIKEVLNQHLIKLPLFRQILMRIASLILW